MKILLQSKADIESNGKGLYEGSVLHVACFPFTSDIDYTCNWQGGQNKINNLAPMATEENMNKCVKALISAKGNLERKTIWGQCI